jgi:hypothetical protein
MAFEGWSKLWKVLKGRAGERTASITIPFDRVIDSGVPIPRLENGQHYFSVVVNEMFLTKAREWVNVYDPMVMVVSEFTYGSTRTVSPFIAGPAMLKDKLAEVPNGIAITDTRVAGLHPYRGGQLAFAIVLARVKRDSHAAQLLQVVEAVSSAFPIGAAVAPHLKVASAIMNGVDSLFGMTETQPLVGHRWEYDDGTTPWLTPGFFVLMSPGETPINPSDLHVVKGRLRLGATETSPTVNDRDYALYSLHGTERRFDIDELPFKATFDTAVKNAAASDEGAWERAKANLMTLYQDMVLSPDLTWTQAETLADDFKGKLLAVKKRREEFETLKAGAENATRADDPVAKRVSTINKIVDDL